MDARVAGVYDMRGEIDARHGGLLWIWRGGMDARVAGVVDLARGKSAPAVRALLIW